MNTVPVASDLSDTRLPTVAIIGMEGSGKTVLISALARHLSTVDTQNAFLDPERGKTMKYVEEIWTVLQNEDWPPSTSPGELFELKWKLHVKDGPMCALRLIDVAGQDLRMLFGDEQIYSSDSLPVHLRSLADYCRASQVVLFLINLRDFIGEGNPENCTSHQAAIKEAMDYLTSTNRNRGVCLVLTQVDLFTAEERECGGWSKVIERYLPYVFNAHVKAGGIKVLPVSAVAETRIVVDDTNTPRRVPVRGFKSQGLDDLTEWLVSQNSLRQPPTPPDRPPPGTSPWQRLRSWIIRHKIPVVITAVCLLFLLFLWIQNLRRVTYQWNIDYDVLWFQRDDIWLENTSRRTLTNVELTVHVVLDGKRWQPITLRADRILPGQKVTWPNVKAIPRRAAATSELRCDQNR